MELENLVDTLEILGDETRTGGVKNEMTLKEYIQDVYLTCITAENQHVLPIFFKPTP